MTRHLIWFVPATLALLAVLSLIIQLVFPRIDLYKDDLLNQIEYEVGAKISIGSMKTELHGYEPIINLHDVIINRGDGGSDLRFASLKVKFDLLASLWQRRFIIRDIYVQDGEFTLVVGKDNKIHGIPPIFAPRKDQHFGVHLENITLTLQNLILEQEYVFKETHLRVESRKDRQRIVFETRLPDTLGEELSISADFNGIFNMPDSWQGYFHITAERLQIAQWLQLFPVADKNYNGELSFDTWGQFDGRQIEWSQGGVRCDQCVDPYGNEVDFTTAFFWEQDDNTLQFSLSNATLKTSQFAFDSVNLRGKWHTDDQIDLAVHAPKINNQQLKIIGQQLGMSSEVFTIATQSGNLSMVVSVPAPRLREPFDWEDTMQVILQHDWTAVDAAKFTVTLEDGDITLPAYLTETMPYEKIVLSTRFIQDSSKRALIADNFLIRADGAVLQGRGGWYNDPDLDTEIFAAIEVADLALTTVPKWLPTGRFNPKFAQWLGNAFVRGTIREGHIRFSGKADNFPFIKHEGDFSWSASVRDMEMNYRSQRAPLKKVDAEIIFNKQTLMADISNLQYYDLHSDDMRVQIDDIFLPFLEIQGSLQGPLADVFEYLKQAQLVDRDSFLIRNIRFEGDSRLAVSVGAPLTKRLEKPVQVQGILTFIQSDFSVPTLDINLNDINGDLSFDRQGGSSDALDLLWNGARLSGKARPLGDSTLLSFEGDLATGDLVKSLIPIPTDLVSGNSVWNIDVNLPNLRPGQLMQIKMASDMEGSAIHLPQPFQKASTEKQIFEITITPGETDGNYQFSYADIAHGKFGKTAKYPESVGHIYFGETPQFREDKGLLISGQIKRPVSVDNWFALKKDNEKTSGDYPVNIDIVFTDLLLGGVDLGKLALKVDHISDRSQKMKIDSSDIAGEINISHREDVMSVYADMQRLRLQKKKMLEILNTDGEVGSLPKSEILIQDFQYEDLKGEDVVLLLSPIRLGTRVDKLRLKVDDIVLISEGRWQAFDTGIRSVFELSLTGDNYGEFFNTWGISQGVVGGKGRMHGRLLWPGSPKDFSFEKVHGEINLDLKDGTIKQFEPGVGRLLGLMNIGTIVRRLSFDFRDVFKEGLSFDDLTADLKFRNGNMHTENFSLAGPSAGVLLKGRTGIIARDYDQQVEVVPNLSSSLPLVSALLGGPLAGVSVYLLDKLTNIGDQIDEAVVLKYQISGSWDEPKVEFVESEVANRMRKGPLKLLIDRVLPKKLRPQGK